MEIQITDRVIKSSAFFALEYHRRHELAHIDKYSQPTNLWNNGIHNSLAIEE